MTAEFTNIHPPDEHSRTYNLIGDLRAPGSGWSDDANYDCRTAMKPMFPTVEFDPESSCFYAYATTEAAATELASAIDAWVHARRAQPMKGIQP